VWQNDHIGPRLIYEAPARENIQLLQRNWRQGEGKNKHLVEENERVLKHEIDAGFVVLQ